MKLEEMLDSHCFSGVATLKLYVHFVDVDEGASNSTTVSVNVNLHAEGGLEFLELSYRRLSHESSSLNDSKDKGVPLEAQSGVEVVLKVVELKAEAVACTVAIKLCLDLGLRRLEVERDSLTVIKKMKSSEDDRSEILAYIEDMKKMSRDFQVYTFMHIQRSANGVAHQLASEGLKLKLEFLKFNGVPEFPEELVEQDRC
ncbi:hypothetical protein Godav_005733 [Gossypium davidsonii]|uniref:RNase H type-1 domain-containing protein n=1 Tax=Gossypium davidsonii TaxID=34287 RepID=A0A7J8S1G4_GOSDV|nr:hypothetical protein [Gossypium davidsonii]